MCDSLRWLAFVLVLAALGWPARADTLDISGTTFYGYLDDPCTLCPMNTYEMQVTLSGQNVTRLAGTMDGYAMSYALAPNNRYNGTLDCFCYENQLIDGHPYGYGSVYFDADGELFRFLQDTNGLVLLQGDESIVGLNTPVTWSVTDVRVDPVPEPSTFDMLFWAWIACLAAWWAVIEGQNVPNVRLSGNKRGHRALRVSKFPWYSA